ncbi:unnamed protein product [Adineta ricciae]|uniref:Helix-turn-helix domain-containing protein n=1 Tax=Adineta ricciae TaxID=249248 RepID=A0A814NXP4_ADIRI|nr:unnamed protein product [Adineta ricciae]
MTDANQNNPTGNEIDRFHDIYHAHDDDQDVNDDETIYFDDLFTDFYQNEKKNEVPVETINHGSNQNILVDLTVEEQQLSQKLSQLSASNQYKQSNEKEESDLKTDVTIESLKRLSSQTAEVTTAATTVKRMKINVVDVADSDMPRYLSKSSKIFEEKIKTLPELEMAISSKIISIEQLRQTTVLIHKIQLHDLNISLWTTYLHSGTGKLKNILQLAEKKEEEREQSKGTNATSSVDLQLWPDEVKTSMIEHCYTTLQAHEIDHNTCLSYVHHKIRQFRDLNTSYREQLQERKEQQLKNTLIPEMEIKLTQFVEEYGIAIHRIPIESEIATVKFQYNDRLLELEFYQEDPYPYQIEVFNKLSQEKQNKETARLEVAVLKQRVVHQHLPSSFESLRIPTPITLDRIRDETIRQNLTQQCTQLFERTKSEMMMIYIQTAEAKLDEYRKTFDTTMTNYEANQCSGTAHRNASLQITSPFFRQSSDGQELNLSRRSDIDKSNIGCSPSLYQDTINHHLTMEQINYLNRGPTYVSPCQQHLSIHQINPIDRVLRKQIAPLHRQLTRFFTKYPIDISRRLNFEKQIEKLFEKSFSSFIPLNIEQYAKYEQQLVQSIKYQLEKDHLLLRRTADNNNTYYLGDLKEFNCQTNAYMTNAMYFKMLGFIDEKNSEEHYITQIIHSINSSLEELHQKGSIRKQHLPRMLAVPRINTSIPHLYFLPQINFNRTISVQARISSCVSTPIQPLASYLYQLLRPLFENYSQSTSLRNGGDFIRKFEYYCSQSDSLLPETKFVTYEIHNLHKRVSHDDIMNALHQFLTTQKVNVLRHDGLSNDTIQQLTQIFLRNLQFSYQGKMFSYVKGCPFNYRLSRLLLNIYLHYWQQHLVGQIRLADEFYGRYYNMGIMTWFGSITSLQACFTELNYQHPDVQITQSTGLNVHFLNVYIENQNGKLYTRIYHDSKKQPFLLPYVTGHPRLIHRQWLHYSLIRAGQSCSTLTDFQIERLYIELTFLANGYTLEFVEYNLDQFYKRFNVRNQQPNILDRQSYVSLRRELFRCIDTERRQFEEREQLIQKQQWIEFYYLYDWGSRCNFNDSFRKLWFTIIEQDPKYRTYGLKVKLNTRHCYLSNSLLTDY